MCIDDICWRLRELMTPVAATAITVGVRVFYGQRDGFMARLSITGGEENWDRVRNYNQSSGLAQWGVEDRCLTGVDKFSEEDQSTRAQELCESRGGRPGLLSLINLRFLWPCLCCFTSSEARLLIRDGDRGEEAERVKARPRIPPEKDRRDHGPPPEQWEC